MIGVHLDNSAHTITDDRQAGWKRKLEQSDQTNSIHVQQEASMNQSKCNKIMCEVDSDVEVEVDRYGCNSHGCSSQ